MDVRRISAQLPFLKKKRRTKGLTALALVDGGVALAHVSHRKKKVILTACEFIETPTPFTDIKLLRERVDALGLTGSETVGLLDQGAYQLLLVDAPDVPPEEMAGALRWRVKDLVGFDAEAATIDYIELPDDAYRGRSRMVYAVVAEQTQSDRLTSWIEEIGLTPAVVDVPELALLNITKNLMDDEAGLVIFHLGTPSSSVSLLSAGALYFTRSLSYDVVQAQRDPYPAAGSAVLELQRSLDYYESQVGKPPCVKLHVLPMQTGETALMTELRSNLPLDVELLDLAEVLPCEQPLGIELQQRCLLAIAAAFRVQERSESDSVR
ncbi:MAG: hypothetical protein ACPGF7_12675 [Pontibacterium sp.]